MTEQDQGQRRGQRNRLVTFAWYKVVGKAADDASHSEEGIVQSCDISQNGVGVVTPRPLAPGTRIFLEVATQQGKISLVGRVAHCHADGPTSFRAGIQVEIVPPTDRATFATIRSA